MILTAFLALVDGPLFPGLATAPTVYPGSPAPTFAVGRWLKKGPVSIPEKGIAVVEFWATWCGPCRESIPHLTELAHANKDVTFVGLSIWEPDAPKIDAFVAKLGDQMDYPVAYGDEHGPISSGWMGAAGNDGIPTAFLIKDRIVQWIGDPRGMDEALAQVKAGTFDVKKAQAEYYPGAAEKIRAESVDKKLELMARTFDMGQRGKARRMFAAVKKEAPGRPELSRIKLMWQAADDKEGFLKGIPELLASGNDDTVSDVTTVAMVLVERGKESAPTGAAAMELVYKAAKKDKVFLAYQTVKAFAAAGDTVKAKQFAAEGLKELGDKKGGIEDQVRGEFQAVVDGKPLPGKL